MTEKGNPTEFFDTSIAITSIEHLASLAKSADQLRWASLGAMANIHREALPPGVRIEHENEGYRTTYRNPTTSEGKEQENREGHHDGLIWVSLTSLLNTAAKMSGLLWGKGHRDVRQNLRHILDQPEDKRDSVIGEKSFRNYFEHQDERLLDFLEKQRSGRDMNSGRIFSEKLILPEVYRTEAVELGDFMARNTLFWWAPDVDKLWHLDEELDMGKLVNEVIKIGAIASSKRALSPDELLA